MRTLSGRPRKLTDEELNQAAEWVAEGRSSEAIASALGVAHKTLRIRLNEINRTRTVAHAAVVEAEDHDPIGELGWVIGEGVANRFHRAGFTTVGAVRRATNAELLAGEGIGVATVQKARQLGLA